MKKPKKNRIDHVVLILDGSGSMGKHKDKLIKFVDEGFIQYLADKYQQTEQETRISVFSFSGRFEFECLVYDTDVLRFPRIAETYDVYSQTDLIDASIRSIDHLMRIPTEFGDHAFLVYLFTDGEENCGGRPSALSAKLNSLPDNWSFGGFVPDKHAAVELERCGVPAANIKEWDAASSDGIVEAGAIIRTTTDNFKVNRAAGIRGSKNLFTMNVASAVDIQSLEFLPNFKYSLVPVSYDMDMSEFIPQRIGVPYVQGEGFYQLTKLEEIQDYKQIAILFNGKLYTGSRARTILGLPDSGTVKVNPRDSGYVNYVIFVQSGAPNRKVLAGTNMLLIPGTKLAKATWTPS